jgi:hypothetical protein
MPVNRVVILAHDGIVPGTPAAIETTLTDDEILAFWQRFLQEHQAVPTPDNFAKWLEEHQGHVVDVVRVPTTVLLR